MSLPEPAATAGLLAWGTVVGLDLVTGPQALLSRPLVAGTVAGLIVGVPEAGLRVGAALELFALDVLPVGAARYPDYGPATVAAVAAASILGSGLGSLGLAVGVGLLLAAAGGWSMDRLREGNSAMVRGLEPALTAGDPRVIGRLQARGALRDAARSFLLTALGLMGAAAMRWAPRDAAVASVIGLVAVGGAAYAATAGSLRRAPEAGRWMWFAAGLGAGIVTVAFVW